MVEVGAMRPVDHDGFNCPKGGFPGGCQQLLVMVDQAFLLILYKGENLPLCRLHLTGQGQHQGKSKKEDQLLQRGQQDDTCNQKDKADGATE